MPSNLACLDKLHWWGEGLGVPYQQSLSRQDTSSYEMELLSDCTHTKLEKVFRLWCWTEKVKEHLIEGWDV